MSVNFPVKKPGAKSLRSLQSLSDALDISISDLQAAKKLTKEERYKRIEIPKVNGDVRVVYRPDHRIRRIQRRINKRIFKELILWPSYLFGSIPSTKPEKREGIERHYIACAQKHCNAKIILKLDIRNFFENIHKDIVEDIFSKVLKYKGDALNYLVDLCCFDDNIVQGALTSSYIASLCLHDLEYDVYRRAERKKLAYTRLVDDITVSSKTVNYDMGQIRGHIEEMLNKKDLPININKSEVHDVSTEPLTVHGLRVSFDKPRLASDEVRRIKASVYNITQLAMKNNSKTTVAYRIEYNRCMGRVNKLGRVKHNKHLVLLNILKAIKPRASLKDIERTYKLVVKLEREHLNGNSDQYKYKKDHDLAVYNLVVLNRTKAYVHYANWLKNRLDKIKPNVEKD